MRKAIMTRSRLQNKWYKHGSLECELAFKHQRNYCNRLYKKERRTYYENLNVKSITDNKKFWKTVKPLLGDKGGKKEKIVLVKGDRIIQEEAEVAKTFNDFFDNAVKSLGIKENKMLLTDVIDSQGKVLALKSYLLIDKTSMGFRCY